VQFGGIKDEEIYLVYKTGKYSKFLKTLEAKGYKNYFY
jgi:hypothetical protein